MAARTVASVNFASATRAQTQKSSRAAPCARVATKAVSTKMSSFRGAKVVAQTRMASAKRCSIKAQAAEEYEFMTEEQLEQEIGMFYEEFLVKHLKDDKLRLLLLQLADCCKTIAYKVRTASCGKVACINAYGDEQLAVDMIANKCLLETLEYSGVCECAVSEEEPEVVPIEGVTDGYSVAFDPLDGSSIVDTNFAVGTIFGIWPGSFAKTIPGITGRDQAAAGVCVYGPRTCLTVAFKHLPGCFEFQLQDDGKFILVKDTFKIHEGKMFSPGNLRATFDNPQYEKLVQYWINEQYTLRYTGGMVPDVFQIIVKEKGVFTNVTSPTTKAKLRLCFEVAPLGLLVEKAGGFSSADGQCVSALDVEIKEIDQRTQVCYGSYDEVSRFEEYLFGKVSPRLAEAAPSVTA